MKAMRIYKIVMVAVFFGIVPMSSAVEETWTRKTDIPTARLGLSTSVVNGKIYAIGGGWGIEGPHSRIVEEYDPVTDSWARRADMPTGRVGHAASVINGKIYVLGGDVRKEVSGAELEEYDPATDTWAAKASMPTKRTFLCACAVDGKIYAIGGITAPAMHTPSALEVYDPATDSWTRKNDIPTTRSMAAATVVDGKIYVIGGVIGDVGGSGVSIVEEYDPVTDIWTRKTNMLTSRKALSVSTVDGKIYASGGGTGYNNPFSVMEEYDTATDNWSRKANMPITRYFHSTCAVGYKIFVFGGAVEFPPFTSTSTVEEYDPNPLIVDFNGDGIVDIKDLLRLIESWGQDDPLVDIAPPFGDGMVDILDLEVLMNHWQEEVIDPTLIARWKLDETDGDTAHDSIEGNDGFGPPDLLWRPENGKVGGALELDGIDDSIVTTFSLNPVQTEFSAFAWIKGGGSDQVALSQNDGVNWLLADSEGQLMTALRRGSSGPTLTSEYIITDGDWHHIGVVWDKLHRHLYADGIEVAEDSNNLGYLSASNGNLCIGCGSGFVEGSFFSGLIDDVRIYNIALSDEKIAALAQ